MSHVVSRASLVGLALALSACATQTMPTQVTRFHLGGPIARGAVSVEPRDAQSFGGLEFATYADSVTRELARAGFQTAPGPRSELQAIVDVVRGSRDAGVQRSPFSIGLGGGTFGRGLGVGGGVSFPVGRPRSNSLVTTEMAVQIKRRSEGTVIWEGRARTEARPGTPAADPRTAADKLATALFAGFPGESGRTINVR